MAHDRVTKDDFENALTTATEQHFRSYTQSFALHVRWEDDNTEAERDCRNFQSFLHSFGFCTPAVLELSRDDTTPGWTAVSKFAEMLKTAKKAAVNGRCIIFFHYAGHGTQGPNDALFFASASGLKSFNAERLFSDADLDGLILANDSSVDVIFILDCCYSFLATKAAKPVGRVVEVLAAVDANTPGAFIPGQRVSFTGKLATKAAFLKGRGYQSIELAEIMSLIRAESPIKKPSHTVRIGTSSVRLWYSKDISNTTLRGPPKLRAVFQVHVDETFTQEELKNFIGWIHLLGPRVGLSLDAVYETGSMCLIFQAPYSVFSKLNGIPGIHLICETTITNRLVKESANLADIVKPSLTDPNVIRALPKSTENIHPSK